MAGRRSQKDATNAKAFLGELEELARNNNSITQNLSCNLSNFLRRLALPKKIMDWSLRTLQIKLIKIGTKVDRLI